MNEKQYDNRPEIPENIRKLQQKHMSSLNMIPKEIATAKKKKSLFASLRATGLMLALWHSGFQCERCGRQQDLTNHHMINRRNRKYMPFIKYSKQRYYYGNQAILCYLCHFDLEKLKNITEKDYQLIRPNKIDRIKKELRWIG